METTTLSTAQIISALLRAPHASRHAGTRERDLRTPAERLRDAYFQPPLDLRMAQAQDPDFFAHLLAWHHHKGEIRDAKAALPIVALAARWRLDIPAGRTYAENALAHLADLNPKLLVKALDFGKLIGAPKHLLHRLVTRYLRDLEGDRRDFETTALQHRVSLHRLYARYHVRPDALAQQLLFAGHAATPKFAIVAQLPSMSPLEILAAVERYKLPWLVVRGALGARAKEPDVLMALISRMTPADLATSSKWLVRAGVKDHPQTRAAYEALVEKSGRKKTRGATLKAGKAAKVLGDLGEEKLAGKLQAVQEKQLEQRRTVEGNWLIIADKSNSMQATIALARQVAAILARSVQGAVHLVFCDTEPHYAGNVSGKSLEAIEMTTAAVMPGGGTSLGCGLKYARVQGWPLDGIAVVSDGAENTYPDLGAEYRLYCGGKDRQPTVYWYRVDPDRDPRTPGWIAGFEQRMATAGADMAMFNLCAGMIDRYSLPTLIETMRAGKYSLVDEIRGYRLRTLDEVLTRTIGVKVLSGRALVAR